MNNFVELSEEELFYRLYGKEISKIENVQYACPLSGLTLNKREEFIKNLASSKKEEFNKEKVKEKERVLNNLKNMKLGFTERMNEDTLIMRVIGGWIYIHETYNNNINPTVISTTTTFVPEK